MLEFLNEEEDYADGDLDPDELEPEEPEGADGDDSIHADDGLGEG